MKKAFTRQGLPFFKVHGAGNDMLIFAGKDLALTGRKKKEWIRGFAHRQLGLGADQVLEILSLNPLSIQIWNCDGTQAEMCANGARTFLFLADREGWIWRAQRVSLKVSGRFYEGIRVKGGTFEFCLGAPKVNGLRSLALRGKKIPFWDVSVRNPHAVIFTKGERRLSPWKAPIGFDYREYGSLIEGHPLFPAKTNVEFVRDWKIKGSRAFVSVEAWERGAGATLSCGSGAVAVATIFRQKFSVSSVQVRMTNFDLMVRFDGEKAHLSGPCVFVAKGQYAPSASARDA